ncbi:MAG: hypothetical protein HC927_01790, partial [Deltaproteobacteria bacterium]|nr:hypothetical protein [Deltaproteobacteria bacterium]
MSTIHWFRADEGGLQGHGREDYVYVRGWAVDQGPALFQTSCMSSSGKAEGRVQAGRASERGDEVSYRIPHGPSNYYNSRLTGQMLANEVASALDEPQRWRDYAGWLWH